MYPRTPVKGFGIKAPAFEILLIRDIVKPCKHPYVLAKLVLCKGIPYIITLHRDWWHSINGFKEFPRRAQMGF